MLRIPTTKIYRAFPELDRFTDSQCQRLMQRVKLHGAAQAAMVGSVVLGLGVGLVLGIALAVLVAQTMQVLWGPMGPGNEVAMMLAVLTCLGLTPALLALVARDILLRRYLVKAITIKLERVRCPACQYILIGQRAEAGAVRCPECGAATPLQALGITEADLIPPTRGDDPLESI